ncbi:prepilin peptidase [Corynebacterium mendelii]|uniref:Prepilin peptidase n=1 Tax=Corynebacterium mendelii TaxID=2765362 RepID=A0A939IX82_9CORY|nr:prepilin peptidase [Corynebacterium mendelii]
MIICRSLTQGAVVFGLVACITVGVWAVGLAVMDCCTGFLPDVLTWPGTVAALIGAVAWGRPELAVGGLAWAVLYLVVAGCVGGVGGGDIKFAPALGTASATGGVLGVCLAIAVAAVATVVMLVAGKRDTIPHAPAMVVGCLVSVACTITGAPV